MKNVSYPNDPEKVHHLQFSRVHRESARGLVRALGWSVGRGRPLGPVDSSPYTANATIVSTSQERASDHSRVGANCTGLSRAENTKKQVGSISGAPSKLCREGL